MDPYLKGWLALAAQAAVWNHLLFSRGFGLLPAAAESRNIFTYALRAAAAITLAAGVASLYDWNYPAGPEKRPLAVALCLIVFFLSNRLAALGLHPSWSAAALACYEASLSQGAGPETAWPFLGISAAAVAAAGMFVAPAEKRLRLTALAKPIAGAPALVAYLACAAFLMDGLKKILTW